MKRLSVQPRGGLPAGPRGPVGGANFRNHKSSGAVLVSQSRAAS